MQDQGSVTCASQQRSGGCGNVVYKGFLGPPRRYCRWHIDEEPDHLFARCASAWRTNPGDGRGCGAIVVSDLRYCLKHVDQALQSQPWHVTAQCLALVEHVLAALDRSPSYVRQGSSYRRLADAMRRHLAHTVHQVSAEDVPGPAAPGAAASALHVPSVDATAMRMRLLTNGHDGVQVMYVEKHSGSGGGDGGDGEPNSTTAGLPASGSRRRQRQQQQQSSAAGASPRLASEADVAPGSRRGSKKRARSHMWCPLCRGALTMATCDAHVAHERQRMLTGVVRDLRALYAPGQDPAASEEGSHVDPGNGGAEGTLASGTAAVGDASMAASLPPQRKRRSSSRSAALRASSAVLGVANDLALIAASLPSLDHGLSLLQSLQARRLQRAWDRNTIGAGYEANHEAPTLPGHVVRVQQRSQHRRGSSQVRQRYSGGGGGGGGGATAVSSSSSSIRSPTPSRPTMDTTTGGNTWEASENAVCPLCSEVLIGLDNEGVNEHVDQCLGGSPRTRADASARSTPPAPPSPPSTPDWSEYEWAGQHRVRATALLRAESDSSRAQAADNEPNSSEELDIVDVAGDGWALGPHQYTEADITRAALLVQQASGGTGSQTGPNPLAGSEQGAARTQGATPVTGSRVTHEKPGHSSGGGGGDGGGGGGGMVLQALRDEILSMRKCLKHVPMCTICLEPHNKPVVSIVCWHTHCEDCWLRTLGTKKLCPQCQALTSASDLRRIYM